MTLPFVSTLSVAAPSVASLPVEALSTAAPPVTSLPVAQLALASPPGESLLAARSGEALVESLPALFTVEALVETATGWPGMGVVFAYSFLIAFVLPGPSEVVLAAPIDVGLSPEANLATIMLVSATGKAAGSVFAFHIGQEVKNSGPVERWLRRSRWDILGWSEKHSVGLARRYGHGGLAVALSVPFFPDTVSIYAFAVLEEDYARFAAATFVGSIGRLLVTLGVLGGLTAVL